MANEVEITITVNGRNHNLQGIPEKAFLHFQENTKRHFPDAGNDAWAHALVEVILSFTTHESYFLSDIPKENSIALEEILKRVGWSFEQLHTYLLHSALKPGALRILSFHEENQERVQLGTLLVTGIRKSTFDKLEKKVEVTSEEFFGLLIQGFEKGVITVTPDDAFSTIIKEN